MYIAELDEFLSSKNFWLYSIYMHSVIMIELVRVHVRWIDGDELVVKRLGQCESGERENNICGRTARLNAVTFTNETDNRWLN